MSVTSTSSALHAASITTTTQLGFMESRHAATVMPLHNTPNRRRPTVPAMGAEPPYTATKVAVAAPRDRAIRVPAVASCRRGQGSGRADGRRDFRWAAAHDLGER